MNGEREAPDRTLAGRLRVHAPWLAAAALGVAALSLALNLFLLWRLRGAEARALGTAREVVDRLAAEDATLRYQIRIPASTPVRMDIPVDERLRVKLNTRLPIDTQVRVPLRGPFGTYNVSVPIKTVIPIQTDVPLHVQHTFRLRTRTEDDLVIPMEIRVRDLPLDAVRKSLEP